MVKDTGVPGNSMQEQVEFQRQLIGEARSIRDLERWIRTSPIENVFVQQVKFLVKDDEGTNVLMVITTHTDEGKQVGFIGGSSVLDCIRMFTRKVGSGHMRWKDDNG